MILTISEKIKHCRDYFGLSQSQFSSYGISQHYLSMIESGKRNPSDEVKGAIYNALYQLTDSKVEQLYSKASFLITPEDEIQEWIEKQYDSGEKLLEKYDEIVEGCKKVGSYHHLYQIDYKVGLYYKSKNSELAIHFLLKAVNWALLCEVNPIDCYYMIGKSMNDRNEFDKALDYYLLADKYLENKESLLYYRIQFDIASLFLKTKKLSECNNRLDLILMECRDEKLRAATYLLKARYLFHSNQIQEGKSLLLDFIEQNPYEPFLAYAYYHLSYQLFLLKEYEEALLFAEKSISSSTECRNYVMSALLLSQIYRMLNRYDDAYEICMLSKQRLMNSPKVIFIEKWYKGAMELFLEMNDWTNINSLIDELKLATLSQNTLNELKICFLEQIVESPTIDFTRQKQYYNKLKAL